MGQIIDYPLTADERRPFRRRRRVDDAKVGTEELGVLLILPVIYIERSEPQTSAQMQMESAPSSSAHPILQITSSVTTPAESTMPPEPVFSQDQLSGDVQARLMSTASFVGLGALPSTPDFVEAPMIMPPLVGDNKVAYYAMQHCVMRLGKTTAALRKESDNMSSCIPLFDEIYEEMMRMLPKIKP